MTGSVGRPNFRNKLTKTSYFKIVVFFVRFFIHIIEWNISIKKLHK